MSQCALIGLAGTCAAMVMFIGAGSALAHTIVGNRLFPVTLAIDDPGVNDELALPSFGSMASANPDGTRGPISYTLGWEYSKTITADLAVSIGSEGITWQRNPSASGWMNIETQAKYVFYKDPAHEFIFSGALSVEWGNTGSPASASIPADPFTTVIPKLFIGKGFGDASVDWLRPFAITGEVDYSVPTTSINALDLSRNPTVLTYGATLQYSLLYANSFVHEQPEFFNRLIPAFEAVFSTPVSNIGPSDPDAFVHTTTGVVGPSVYYIGRNFEVGVMAQIPINHASGRHVGVMGVVDFFLDDIAPTTLGKPLFGSRQVRSGAY